MVWSQVITRLPLDTPKLIDLLSFPSALIAVTVAVNGDRLDALPEITPELLILNPLANPLADQEVGLRSAGICKFTG